MGPGGKVRPEELVGYVAEENENVNVVEYLTLLNIWT